MWCSLDLAIERQARGYIASNNSKERKYVTILVLPLVQFIFIAARLTGYIFNKININFVNFANYAVYDRRKKMHQIKYYMDRFFKEFYRFLNYQELNTICV